MENFIRKNNLSTHVGKNIKRSRSSVDKDDILEFFNIMIYNYDETNISDDPG